jgi:predicted nucleotidyltransferase component of viral defense system
MITKEEIDLRAKEFEIPQTSVEKDYVFGWILFGIFTVSDLRDIIFLKGGNALRKGYFENTRFSSDLDFGIPYDIAQEKLLAEVNKVCDFIEQKAGVKFLKSENKIEEKFAASEAPIPDLKVFEVRVYFKDFYGKGDHIRLKIAMDVTRFDKVLLPLQTVRLIHPYSDADTLSCNIRCMKLEEIIATKLKCLLQRQHAPDLFDYAYSIKLLGGELNKKEVIETLIRKTIFGRNPHVLKKILKQTPFVYFESYWIKGIVCAKSIVMDVKEAINLFLLELEDLFSIYPDNGYHQFVYFGPELRIPIIEAGRKQALLKIRYNGADRIVEPYALKYLQRKDGTQREYLYVYNRSGGSNPPGLRSLVADNFQSIEITDEKFEPQYPIELSKAGEKPENPYLFDPNRPTKTRARRTSRVRRSGPRYIYQCNICGRKFSKTKMNNGLGEHKNKSDHRCGGRFGIYVTTKW